MGINQSTEDQTRKGRLSGIVSMTLVLADIVAAVHLAFVAYVIAAQVLIVVGVLARWAWVRNAWFRVSHLVMIGVVAVESLVDFDCPLTTWENLLRKAAGQETG